jgi:hypothetical protein
LPTCARKPKQISPPSKRCGASDDQEPRRSRKRTHLRSFLWTHRVRRLTALVTAVLFLPKPAALHQASALIPTVRPPARTAGPHGGLQEGERAEWSPRCLQRRNCGPRTDA